MIKKQKKVNHHFRISQACILMTNNLNHLLITSHLTLEAPRQTLRGPHLRTRGHSSVRASANGVNGGRLHVPNQQVVLSSPRDYCCSRSRASRARLRAQGLLQYNGL